MALSFSSRAEASRSLRTPRTRSSLPSSSAAAAAWARVQKRHSFCNEVHAAISSRIAGLIVAGVRRTPWLKRERLSVNDGWNANRSQIFEYSALRPCAEAIRSLYIPGFGWLSTPGRYSALARARAETVDMEQGLLMPVY